MSKEKAMPVMVIQDQEQLDNLLTEWKSRLGLGDWFITAELCNPEDMSDGNNNLAENHFVWENKTSHILIARQTEKYREESKVKVCDEKSLVHELLHCLLNFTFLTETGDNYSEIVRDKLEHQTLDQLARGFIMTKYGLPFEWWYATDGGKT